MGLDSVELVMEFEDEFEIEISDSIAEKMLTIGDAVRFLARQKKIPENDTVRIQTVRDRVCKIVREQMGGKLPPITDESRFYEDLGVT